MAVRKTRRMRKKGRRQTKRDKRYRRTRSKHIRKGRKSRRLRGGDRTQDFKEGERVRFGPKITGKLIPKNFPNDFTGTFIRYESNFVSGNKTWKTKCQVEDDDGMIRTIYENKLIGDDGGGTPIPSAAATHGEAVSAGAAEEPPKSPSSNSEIGSSSTSAAAEETTGRIPPQDALYLNEPYYVRDVTANHGEGQALIPKGWWGIKCEDCQPQLVGSDLVPATPQTIVKMTFEPESSGTTGEERPRFRGELYIQIADDMLSNKKDWIQRQKTDPEGDKYTPTQWEIGGNDKVYVAPGLEEWFSKFWTFKKGDRVTWSGESREVPKGTVGKVLDVHPESHKPVKTEFPNKVNPNKSAIFRGLPQKIVIYNPPKK